MSVIVLSTDRIAAAMHATGHLFAAGVIADLPDMPADTNPHHPLATGTADNRVA